jgi:hypothetical protein
VTELLIWAAISAIGVLVSGDNLRLARRARSAAQHLEPAYVPEGAMWVRFWTLLLAVSAANLLAAVLATIGGLRVWVLASLIAGNLLITLTSAYYRWGPR